MLPYICVRFPRRNLRVKGTVPNIDKQQTSSPNQFKQLSTYIQPLPFELVSTIATLISFKILQTTSNLHENTPNSLKPQTSIPIAIVLHETPAKLEINQQPSPCATGIPSKSIARRFFPDRSHQAYPRKHADRDSKKRNASLNMLNVKIVISRSRRVPRKKDRSCVTQELSTDAVQHKSLGEQRTRSSSESRLPERRVARQKGAITV